MTRSLLIVLFLFIAVRSVAQDIYINSIKGNVVDKSTQIPLPGASVILLNSDPLNGTSTDANGDFRLENVPVGRQNIRVSFIGYKTITLTNLAVTTGKELVLTIELDEAVSEIKEVVIRAETGNDMPINEMAAISARSFTVEETERFAGSIGDPARMASNFAGVSTLSDQKNEIVIRGNSPMGLLWRLDGADIPNPNHFASLGTTGGGLSMLNNNTLSNSDFFTGAFPAEYGNALSGVFDLKMRNGNNEHYEFTGQVGFNGLEAGAEGPISKKLGSSFMLNYRYSALILVDKVIGTEALSVSAVPFYHDLSFKFKFPGRKYGSFSITGVGGISGINEVESTKDTSEWSSKWEGSDYKFGSRMGTVIASHSFFFNSKTRLESYIGLSGANSAVKQDTFTIINEVPKPQRRQDSWQSTLQFGGNLRKKLTQKDFYDIGLNVRFIFYKFEDKSAGGGKDLVAQIQTGGNSTFLKAYYQWQHKYTDELVLNAGINGLFFGYNKKFTADPRLSMKWQITGRQSVSLGTGIFSQLPELIFYFTETTLPGGKVVRTNKNLGYMKSFHLVLGYDFLIAEHLRIKSEVYFQHLFNIPVKENQQAYSMLNFGEDSFSTLPIIDSLVNKGTGYNAGIEFTIEKFLHRGYYILFTSSFFKSTYKGYDEIERNTAFSNNFVLNLLAGKEFRIRGKNFLNFDLRTTWAGGMRYVPFHTVQAADHYYIKVDEWDKAYQERRPNYFRLNLRIGYKVNFKKATLEVAVDCLNVTNQKNIFFEFYDPGTGEIKTVYQFPFLPLPLIRIQF